MIITKILKILHSKFIIAYYRKRGVLIKSSAMVGRNLSITFNKKFSKLQIGHNFKSGNNFRLDLIHKYYDYSFQPEIHILDDVSINNNVHIGAINKIIIGKYCLIGSNVLITDHSHGDLNSFSTEPFKYRKLFSKGPVIIKDNVWIGENSSILGNVTIGENVVIGCNSVVTKDIPPNSIYAGSPAKKIKDFEK